MKNPETGQSEPKEQTMEEILDTLESAFEKGVVVNLIVSEPSGKLRENTVFVEGLEDGMLFVSVSKDSAVMGIKLENIKGAR